MAITAFLNLSPGWSSLVENLLFYFKALLTIWAGVYGVIAVASIPLLFMYIYIFKHMGESLHLF